MGAAAVLILAGLVSSVLARPGVLLSAPLITALPPAAPIGPDGRVVDTAEVAVARAEHAAAQVNERLRLADEAARSVTADLNSPVVQLVANGLVAPLQDTPEVAAQLNERINLINLANEGRINLARSGLLASNNAVLVPGAPIGLDGRVQDTPEVAVAKAAHAAVHLNEKLNLANEAAKSADVVAVAGPALAYGRLVY